WNRQCDERDEGRHRTKANKLRGRRNSEHLRCQHQQCKRRDRPPDVRDVDGKVAAFSEVTNRDPDRQGNHRGDEERKTGHDEVLEGAVWDAAVALPVVTVEEPLQHLVDEVHVVALVRDQGVKRRWAPARLKSAMNASVTESTVPTTSGVRKSRSRPS